MDAWEIEWADYYEELGVSHSASDRVIQVAYRAMAQEYHPDSGRSPDVERMKRINIAFQCLSDPELKPRYTAAYHARTKSGAHDRRSTTGASSASRGYDPVIEVDTADLDIEGEEGQPIRVEFVVRHVAGDLPTGWFLAVSRDGALLDDASFEMDPPDAFPARIIVDLPPQKTGDYEGSIELSIQSRA